MSNLSCSYCEGTVRETQKSYRCDCGLIIWKYMSGKEITLPIIEELLTNGRTSELDGFTSKNNKPFKASLVLADKKVNFEFANQNNSTSNGKFSKNAGKKADDNTVYIRVESANSGSVSITINGSSSSGKIFKKAEINFGLVGSRMAECFGMITAVKLLKHSVGNVSSTKLDLSINDVNLTRYLLSESIPRKAEDRSILNYLLNQLGDFAEWSAIHQKKKRSRLQGGPLAKVFPKGVFPWIEDPQMIVMDKEIMVKLSDEPEVQHQFHASFWKAEPGGNQGEYILPATAEKAIKAWIYTVKG